MSSFAISTPGSGRPAARRIAALTLAATVATLLAGPQADAQVVNLESHDWATTINGAGYRVKDVYVRCETEDARLLMVWNLTVVLLAEPNATFVHAPLGSGVGTSRPVCADATWNPLWQVDTYFTLGGEQCEAAGVFSFTPDISPAALVNSGAFSTTGGYFLVPPLNGIQTAGPDLRVRVMRLCIRDADWHPGAAVTIAMTTGSLHQPHPSPGGTQFKDVAAILPFAASPDAGPEVDLWGFDGPWDSPGGGGSGGSGGSGGGGVWGGAPEAAVGSFESAKTFWHSANGYLVGWALDATQLLLETAWTPVVPEHLEPVGRGDFDGDGDVDFLFRSITDGKISMWTSEEGLLDSGHFVGAPPSPSPMQWEIAGVADLNGDGRDDVLWRRGLGSMRTVVAWLMDGAAIVETRTLGPSIGMDFLGLGDFNADGRADILWRALNGTILAWRTNANATTTLVYFGNAPALPAVWKAAAVADLDGDGDHDIVWHHQTSGQVNGWIIQNFGRASGGLISNSVPPSWAIVDRVDLDEDGTTDLLWRHASTGTVNAWCMTGLVRTLGGPVGPLPPSWSSF